MECVYVKLYGCETWIVSTIVKRKPGAYETQCNRKIPRFHGVTE